jgi:hypothetical protein
MLCIFKISQKMYHHLDLFFPDNNTKLIVDLETIRGGGEVVRGGGLFF